VRSVRAASAAQTRRQCRALCRATYARARTSPTPRIFSGSTDRSRQTRAGPAKAALFTEWLKRVWIKAPETVNEPEEGRVAEEGREVDPRAAVKGRFEFPVLAEFGKAGLECLIATI
jgi:hypothetical protein